MILKYEYYRDTYKGSLVSEDNFNSYNIRANSLFINYINYDRLESVLNSFMKDSVYIALCELVDSLYKQDEMLSKAHDSDLIGLSGIDSETTKDHSIKFKSTDTSKSKEMLKDFEETNINIIKSHVRTTGLLYRGV